MAQFKGNQRLTLFWKTRVPSPDLFLRYLVHITSTNSQSIQKVNPNCVEIIITLFSKAEIYFYFNFTTESPHTEFVGQSISFKTHNSGSLGSRPPKTSVESKSPISSSPDNSSDVEHRDEADPQSYFHSHPLGVTVTFYTE
jgi:hypothetical protein